MPIYRGFCYCIKIVKMALTGIEPARDKSHTDLNGARLPVPPQRQQQFLF